MGAKTDISWTDATWNPVRGCTKVSPGCKNCYAETFAERFRGVKGHPFEQGFDLRLVPEKLDLPLRWRKPKRIFVNSMSDLFHKGVPDEYIDAVFGVMARCPQHTFQVLTKRPERMRAWATQERSYRGPMSECLAAARVTNPKTIRFPLGLEEAMAIADRGWSLPNVWLGVSVENQAAADERIPILLQTSAAVRFLSCEPLLDRVDLSCIELPAQYNLSPTCPGRIDALRTDNEDRFYTSHNTIDWVIVGGESGPGARPCHAGWARDIVRQCKAAAVPVFVKQLGAAWSDAEYGTAGASLKVDSDVAAQVSYRLKDRKGANMDEWREEFRIREFPSP